MELKKKIEEKIEQLKAELALLQEALEIVNAQLERSAAETRQEDTAKRFPVFADKTQVAEIVLRGDEARVEFLRPVEDSKKVGFVTRQWPQREGLNVKVDTIREGDKVRGLVVTGIKEEEIEKLRRVVKWLLA